MRAGGGRKASSRRGKNCGNCINWPRAVLMLPQGSTLCLGGQRGRSKNTLADLRGRCIPRIASISLTLQPSRNSEGAQRRIFEVRGQSGWEGRVGVRVGVADAFGGWSSCVALRFCPSTNGGSVRKSRRASWKPQTDCLERVPHRLVWVYSCRAPATHHPLLHCPNNGCSLPLPLCKNPRVKIDSKSCFDGQSHFKGIQV